MVGFDRDPDRAIVIVPRQVTMQFKKSITSAGANWHYLRFMLLIGVIVGVIFVLKFTMQMPPYGRFRDDNIGTEGISYWEFSGGKVTLVCRDTAHPRAQGDAKSIGSYRKQNRQWVFVDRDGDTNRLYPGLFCIRIVSADGAWTQSLPRLIGR